VKVFSASAIRRIDRQGPEKLARLILEQVIWLQVEMTFGSFP
jgi:hypothetical protein